MCCCGTSAASPKICELERKIGVYLRRIQGEHGGWPLFHAGAFDISASVKAYFALKMIGDDPDAPHMRARPRGDPGARRRGDEQCLHPLPARAVRRNPVARRAGHAGRDHAAAALVSVPPRQDFLLGAHGAGAFAGAAGAEAAGGQSARRRASRNCSSRPPETVRAWPAGAHQARLRSSFFDAVDWRAEARRAVFPEAHRASAPSTRRSPS